MTPCPACSAPIEPFRGGYPGGLLIPTHPTASGTPCRASQGPYKALAPGQEATTASTASGTVLLAPALAYKAPSRAWLKAPTAEANIALWLDLVEKQTGKPFNLDGDAYCIAEELGETVEAMFRHDQAEVEDGLCDTYVASHVADLLLRRENETVKDYAPRLQVAWSKLDVASICAIFAGRLASYVRKPAKKTTARAQGVLDALHTSRSAIRRELGSNFNDAMGRVLDILDKRLGEGYQMNSHGSAVKKSDQS